MVAIGAVMTVREIVTGIVIGMVTGTTMTMISGAAAMTVVNSGNREI
ncbi:hypothetical protein ACFXPS_06620 [Nocardia sp. NPDC059091]